MAAVTVRVVQTQRDWEEFIEIPFRLYRGNPCWVPPLRSEVRKLLDPQKNPFWEHARGTVFLAEREGRTVGRISAQIDDNYNNLWNERLGSFGFFECENDQAVADALFDAAAAWVREQGMTVLRGPMSPSSNDEWGFLLDAYDKPPVLMMPYNPPYYLELAERWGLKKAKDLLAFYKHISMPMPPRMRELAEKLRANPRITTRCINMKNLPAEMAIIKDLYNASWQKNWGFSPMTSKEMDLLAENLKTFADPGLVRFAFYDGKPAGLSITLPNINEVLIHLNGRLGPVEMVKFLFLKRRIKGVRAIVFGFKQEYRRLGLPILLFYETEEYGRQRGYEWCEMSWNLEDNRLINDFDREAGGVEYKHYRVMERPLQ